MDRSSSVIRSFQYLIVVSALLSSLNFSCNQNGHYDSALIAIILRREQTGRNAHVEMPSIALRSCGKDNQAYLFSADHHSTYYSSLNMPPATRSASISLSSPVVRAAASASSPAASPTKRARANGSSETPKAKPSPSNSKRAKVEAVVPPPVALLQEASSPTQPKFDISNGDDDSAELVVRPELAFNLEDAKRHLRSVDSRFHSLFERLPCKPFEEDTDLNPFRALCSSILGQQVASSIGNNAKSCSPWSDDLLYIPDILACCTKYHAQVH